MTSILYLQQGKSYIVCTITDSIRSDFELTEIGIYFYYFC